MLPTQFCTIICIILLICMILYNLSLSGEQNDKERKLLYADDAVCRNVWIILLIYMILYNLRLSGEQNIIKKVNCCMLTTQCVGMFG